MQIEISKSFAFERDSFARMLCLSVEDIRADALPEGGGYSRGFFVEIKKAGEFSLPPELLFRMVLISRCISS